MNFLLSYYKNIDTNFIIQFSNEIIDKEAKINCKVLKFSSQWNLKQVLATLKELNPKEFPNLFIFIIEGSNLGSTEVQDIKNEPPIKKLKREDSKIVKLKNALCIFGEDRSVLLLLSSEDEQDIKFYYKNDDMTQLIEIEPQENFFWNIKDFSSFRHMKFDKFLDDVLNSISNEQNRSLILRFLRTLTLSKEFFERMILHVARKGTKSEFLAALDAPFDRNGRMLSSKSQNYISDMFKDDNESKKLSVLLVSVQSSNIEVINYLITFWNNLIQLLPIKHQIRISTAAFETKNFDVLCDLLDIADFPFPKDFKINSDIHKRLFKITEERVNFNKYIIEENVEKLDEFINNRYCLRRAYNPVNISAMDYALENKKYKSFFYLKSIGFEANKDFDLSEIPDKDELEKAEGEALAQKKKNISEANKDVNKSAIILAARTLIHNRRISNKDEQDYRDKIKMWFMDINKIESGPELLNAAVLCERLKIVFDFENETVKRIDLLSNSNGLAYSTALSTIFIGAKLSDKRRDQEIKGTLAHELCHYVMFLIFENHFLPYYKNSTKIQTDFGLIVKALDKWSSNPLNEPDDECNKIISLVYTAYEPKLFKIELIVRAVHILVEFDDNEKHSKYLQEKYKILFDFWFTIVVPEIRKFNLEERKIVEKLNNYIGLLPEIIRSRIYISPSKNITQLVENKLLMVQTFTPTLFLIHINQFLLKKYDKLRNVQNLFIDPAKICTKIIHKEIKEVCAKKDDLNLIVDCSKIIPVWLKEIVQQNNLNYVIIVSNENQHEELEEICNNAINPSKIEINYNWDDLTNESQNSLLNTKINFQNNSSIILKDLLRNYKQSDEPENNKIIDVQLLNLLIDQSNISVNINQENEQTENPLRFLFQERYFWKKYSNLLINSGNFAKQLERIHHLEGIKNMNQKELLSEVKNKQYVLISDKAGNGKSWAVKNIAKILQERNPTRWVTYVDLKNFIGQFKEFKDQEVEPEFSTFMVEHILKLNHQFEAKIFQQLYRDGEVFILFDGFDEIAPKYADFVSKLAQNFQWNLGNQLWMATRDFFETDLKRKLNLDFSYGIVEISEKEGEDMIYAGWIIMDLKKKKQELTSIEKLNEYKISEEYKIYKQEAHEIIKKVTMLEKRSIGLPLLLKMIIEGFSIKKKKSCELKGSKIFNKFILKLHERWSSDKGKIRKKASSKSQTFSLTFWTFHQFSAIESFFPEYAKSLFKNYKNKEWQIAEIIACGIMTQYDGKVYFVHETFREYFVADTIIKTLQNGNIEETTIYQLLFTVLSVKKFEVTRMFLNDSVECINNTETQEHMQNFIYGFKTYHELFKENLSNLSDFIFDILKKGTTGEMMQDQNENYEKANKVLSENVIEILTGSQNLDMIFNFLTHYIEFLKIDDLKKLFKDQEIIRKIIKLGLNTRIIEDFLEKSKLKTDIKFIQDELQRITRKGNIFYFLSQSLKLDATQVKDILSVVEVYLPKNTICTLMNKCHQYGLSIFQANIQREQIKIFVILWTTIKKYFIEYNFKDLVMHKDKNNRNILHYTASFVKSEIHDELWTLLFETFADRDELKNFILQKDFTDSNFVHELLKWNNNPEVIKNIFKMFRDQFENLQFEEILNSKGQSNMNLLQSASILTSDVESFEVIWNEFYQTHKESLEFLNTVDNFGRNILQTVVRHSQMEIFDYLLNKINSSNIKKYLSVLDNEGQNLLQLASWNKSLKLHETLWKNFKRYLADQDILDLVNQLDMNGKCLFCNLLERNTENVLELTRTQVNALKCTQN